jgi:UDP-N-acetylmuramoyl-L-alanyl-D-glutamate--2,6-diaminopimelate ligase
VTGKARPGKPLGELFPDLALDPAIASVRVTGIVSDSRKVKPGDLFAAVPGNKADGLSFVPAALRNGAVAILAQRPPTETGDAVVVVAPDVRDALAKGAARFFGPMPEIIVAVTGTAGKTSVAHFTRQIWTMCGAKAAYLGTLGVISPDGEVYGTLTTPDPIELAATLAELARAGVTHVALEASSHGLDQHRLDGIRFAAAGFTNIGRDHLDYHPNQDAYLDAKLRLFRELLPDDAPAVVADGFPGSQAVLAAVAMRGLPVLTVGSLDADLALLDTEREDLNQRITLEWQGEERELVVPLVGGFQICNALVAAGLAIATGSDADEVLGTLEHLKGVPGRLELIGQAESGAPVFVDYAHKPEALAAALEALRPFASGRLICVFGAGGDRDPGKRPLMGQAAAENADVVIVTDDNPRSENPAEIRKEILAGAPEAQEIGDRAVAIDEAVNMLRTGDVLVVAGKGHETGQIVGDKTLPFDDAETVRAALTGDGR